LSSEKGTHLGQTGTYVLWLLEILLAGGVAASVPFRRAWEPFCERCEEWYWDKDLEIPVGRLQDEKLVRQAVTDGNVPALVAAVPEGGAQTECVSLSFRKCRKCDDAPHYVRVFRNALVRRGGFAGGLGRGRQLKKKVLASGLMPADIAQNIVKEVERARNERKAPITKLDEDGGMFET